MVRHRPNERELARELEELREQYPKLEDDQLFVAWFLRAFVTENIEDAVGALCGGAGDKGVDAILIDDRARIVFLTQGKYHKRLLAHTEPRPAVKAFAHLASTLTGEQKE